MAMLPYFSAPSDPLTGTARVPGDKSISHRAVLLGALAVGETTVSGLLEGEDVLATAAAVRQLGADVRKADDGRWSIRGVGIGGLREAGDVLDMGNSGTAARLILGVLASHPITSFLTGDDSLRSRPMARVTEPLAKMGGRFIGRDGGCLPLCVVGTDTVMPIEYRLPVASAQVKSAILLAGLNSRGHTSVIEPSPTRDHSERMLRHFGATVQAADDADGARRITVAGQPELEAAAISVPADPSSAAFPLVAALIVPGSAVQIPGVCINPTRAGLYDTLIEMGADLAIERRREEGGELVADLGVRHGPLKGVEVPAERAPSMIDEYPILAVAAAHASGKTVMKGLAELRVKESDRLAAVADGLVRCGVKVETGEDWLAVHGTGGTVPGGGRVTTHFDHRIAMSFLILGLGAREPVTIDDARSIETSFPDFAGLMRGLGATMQPVGQSAA